MLWQNTEGRELGKGIDTALRTSKGGVYICPDPREMNQISELVTQGRGSVSEYFPHKHEDLSLEP